MANANAEAAERKDNGKNNRSKNRVDPNQEANAEHKQVGDSGDGNVVPQPRNNVASNDIEYLPEPTMQEYECERDSAIGYWSNLAQYAVNDINVIFNEKHLMNYDENRFTEPTNTYNYTHIMATWFIHFLIDEKYNNFKVKRRFKAREEDDMDVDDVDASDPSGGQLGQLRVPGYECDIPKSSIRRGHRS